VVVRRGRRETACARGADQALLGGRSSSLVRHTAMALVKSIAFVDGENLAIRYQTLVEAGRKPLPGTIHIPDVFVWHPQIGRPAIDTDIIRINYYTSMVGDDDALTDVRETIAAVRYHGYRDYYGPCQLHPRVYKKAKKSTKSRLVDINITIDVMRHAYTDAVDVVYLFSGDGDFVELVEDVGRGGKRICVAAFSSGLDPRLRVVADRFVLLDDLFFEPVPTPGQIAPAPVGAAAPAAGGAQP
jgi:uncharacterized LabA/DUF88 family protein